MRDYNYRVEWSYTGTSGTRIRAYDVFSRYISAKTAVREAEDEYGDLPGFRVEQVHREERDGWYVIERWFWEEE